MLNFIYYPVSAILWFWHRVFGLALGPDNGFAWALSVAFLVFTLRLVLYIPFVKQVRTTRQMQELQPQIKALQTKYKNDRQQMALEMQKLQREHGFNPLMGCLPALVQAPVFIGLYHVLRSFDRTNGSKGLLGFGQTAKLTVEQNADTPNYVFSAHDVQSFLSARIFGAPISAAITTKKEELDSFAHFGGVPHVMNMVYIAVPLMIIAGLATHFNARASVARQSEAAAANPQAAMMNRLALWVFPIGVLIGGPFLPIAILIYWVSNNVWTYGQQHVVFRRIDREEEEKKQRERQASQERRTVNTPKPGAKPSQSKKKVGSGMEPKEGSTETSVDVAEVTGDDAEPRQSSEVTGKAADNHRARGAKSNRPGPRKSGGRKRAGNRGRANQKKRR